MRFEPSKTGAQKLLADSLRAENILFLENQILKGWEVDIFLPSYYLVVEVDGFYHLSGNQQEKDQRKDRCLQAAGFHVLRFTNSQIYQDKIRCVQQIKDIVKKHKLLIRKVEKVASSKTPWQQQLEEYHKKLKIKEKKTTD